MKDAPKTLRLPLDVDPPKVLIFSLNKEKQLTYKEGMRAKEIVIPSDAINQIGNTEFYTRIVQSLSKGEESLSEEEEKTLMNTTFVQKFLPKKSVAIVEEASIINVQNQETTAAASENVGEVDLTKAKIIPFAVQDSNNKDQSKRRPNGITVDINNNGCLGISIDQKPYQYTLDQSWLYPKTYKVIKEDESVKEDEVGLLIQNEKIKAKIFGQPSLSDINIEYLNKNNLDREKINSQFVEDFINQKDTVLPKAIKKLLNDVIVDKLPNYIIRQEVEAGTIKNTKQLLQIALKVNLLTNQHISHLVTINEEKKKLNNLKNNPIDKTKDIENDHYLDLQVDLINNFQKYIELSEHQLLFQTMQKQDISDLSTPYRLGGPNGTIFAAITDESTINSRFFNNKTLTVSLKDEKIILKLDDEENQDEKTKRQTVEITQDENKLLYSVLQKSPLINGSDIVFANKKELLERLKNKLKTNVDLTNLNNFVKNMLLSDDKAFERGSEDIKELFLDIKNANLEEAQNKAQKIKAEMNKNFGFSQIKAIIDETKLLYTTAKLPVPSNKEKPNNILKIFLESFEESQSKNPNIIKAAKRIQSLWESLEIAEQSIELLSKGKTAFSNQFESIKLEIQRNIETTLADKLKASEKKLPNDSKLDISKITEAHHKLVSFSNVFIEIKQPSEPVRSSINLAQSAGNKSADLSYVVPHTEGIKKIRTVRGEE